jgi:hypothetical protein
MTTRAPAALDLYRLIRNSRLDKHAKLVLFALATYWNAQKAAAWPSVATLAAACGMSCSGVRGVLDRLDQKRVITRTRTKGGKGRSCSYRINVAALNPPAGGGLNAPPDDSEPSTECASTLQPVASNPPPGGEELSRELKENWRGNRNAPAGLSLSRSRVRPFDVERMVGAASEVAR